KKETTAHLVLWTPPVAEEMMRFSIIYEFNNSEAIAMYDKYLTEVVTPKIPKNGTVIIHGHTDIIGGEDVNMKLSLARANDVKGIMEKALAKSNRTDVKFDVRGFGEDENLAPFDNKFPEERFYNRSVIIDILPAK
ncbi:MAG: OmpA family protein, partial [Bacteroidota bacterium]|nr:OmpA family protein [Bacteroidota bacterium]